MKTLSDSSWEMKETGTAAIGKLIMFFPFL